MSIQVFILFFKITDKISQNSISQQNQGFGSNPRDNAGMSQISFINPNNSLGPS